MKAWNLHEKKEPADGVLLLIYFALLAVGLIINYATDHGHSTTQSNFSFQTFFGKQLIWTGVAIVVFYLVTLVSIKFLRAINYLMYGGVMILLILVLIFGSTVNGAKSWFHLGFFSFQPAELAKIATTFTLAEFLAGFTGSLRSGRNQLFAIGLVFLPVCLLLLQPDAGSAMVFTSLLFMMYRVGMPGFYFIILGSAAVVFISALFFPFEYVIYAILLVPAIVMLFQIKLKGIRWLGILAISIGIFGKWQKQIPDLYLYIGLSILIISVLLWFIKKGYYSLFVLHLGSILFSLMIAFSSYFIYNELLKPHQQERLDVWLHPERCDPRGALYNILQSQMAISSGGVQGKGFLQGTLTKLNYIPENNTDFIFCTIGEEQGFLGSVAIIVLFAVFLFRLIQVAERQRSNFSRNYIYGVTGILFFHFIVNIGMTMGLFPVIGIPLPFISYGGTSLIGFSLMIGLVINMDRRKMMGGE